MREERQKGRGDRLGTRRPGCRAATAAAPGTPSPCTKRPTASAACCATAFRIQDGKAADRPPAGTDGGRRREVRRPTRTSASTWMWMQLRKGFRRHRAGRRRRGPARSQGAGARTEGHPFRDGVPAAADQARARRYRASRNCPSSPPASTSSSSAAAIPAPIAWAPVPPGRGTASASLRSCRSRPETRAPQTPWPLWPLQLRTESCARRGRHARVEHRHGQLRGRRERQRQASARSAGRPAAEVRADRRNRATIEADLVLLAMGFTGPVRNGMIEQLGVELDTRGNVATDESYMTSVEASSPRATCAAASRWWCGRSPRDAKPPLASMRT